MAVVLKDEKLVEKCGFNRNVVSNDFVEAMKNTISSIDVIDAIRRYTWGGLPDGITGDQIERTLYYYGMGMFFYVETEDKFYFLPFAPRGDDKPMLDVYGRYTGATPLPFGGTKPWINDLWYEPVYSMFVETPTWKDITSKCVLLKDRSAQFGQFNPGPRSAINKPVIELEAKILPYMNTVLMNSTGVDGIITNTVDDAASMLLMNRATEQAALSGKRWVPILQGFQLQDISSHSAGDATTFLQVMESLDNYRLGTMGLENGGLFQKKAHMLGMEQQMAQASNGLVLDDGLAHRQEFCNIVNSLTGIGIYCVVNESEQGYDRNMDGQVGYDDQGQSTPMGGNEQEEVTND